LESTSYHCEFGPQDLTLNSAEYEAFVAKIADTGMVLWPAPLCGAPSSTLASIKAVQAWCSAHDHDWIGPHCDIIIFRPFSSHTKTQMTTGNPLKQYNEVGNPDK
jgi:hypothetical protein